MSLRPVRRALLSVSDKTGLVELAQALAARGTALISTGGTARSLREAGLEVLDVSALTGFPEILDGRVKTLHPRVHGGLLARRDHPEHAATLAEHDIAPIDLLVVNLYPFEESLRRRLDFEAQLEEIDVGGPAMIRAAAKNHDGVAVVVEPADYGPLLDELAAEGGTTAATRRRLAAKAFARTAAYDAAIAGWLAGEEGQAFGQRMTISGSLRQRLRYGENPHQRAAFYVTGEDRPGLATARQLQGKELSYNNLVDADAALALAAEFERPAVAIVKHANPCGAAEAETPLEAWRRALAGDPVSAFGGIVAVNREIDPALADAMGELFLEVVIAPAVAPDALARLARRPNLRVLATGSMPGPEPGLAFRSITGGFLVQDADNERGDAPELRCVTKRAPTPAETRDLLFAWQVVTHTKSNAIVLARDGATVGIGMGQTNRVDSVRIAAERMRHGPGAGACVLASDAFFPFADGLEAGIAAGVTAVIQPGGSVRDPEVIAAADRAGVAMVFTGRRHFRH